MAATCYRCHAQPAGPGGVLCVPCADRIRATDPYTGKPKDRCIHDMLPGSCTICLPKPPPALFAQPSGAIRGAWFTATYAGQCDDCGSHIFPGEQIRADGEGGWICESCGDS